MKTKEIRLYIANSIESIKDIGVVHSSNKLPKFGDEFQDLFEYDGRLQGWIVTRGGIGTAPPSSNFLRIPQDFVIVTFLGYNSSTYSEERFEDSVNVVYKMFSLDRTLGGTVANVTDVSVPEISLVKVGPHYSHYAEIAISIIEFDQ